MPFKNGATVHNITKWTPAMIEFLKINFDKMTNPQLANTLGITLTVTRNKARELGLRHIEMEYWTPVMIEYLKRNYKTTGDVELAKIFQKKITKNKAWSKKHIEKNAGT